MIRLALTLLALLALLAFGLVFHVTGPVLALLAAAVAVKHAAYVLIVGNIFQPLRTAISQAEQRRYEGSLGRMFYRKLRVLFSCNLCMTTQLSLWLVAVPTSYLAHKRLGHIAQNLAGGGLPVSAEYFLTALGTFLLAMAVAGVAMAVWRFSELPAELMELYEALQREKEQRGKITGFASNDNGEVRSAREIFDAIGHGGIIGYLAEIHGKCERESYCIFRITRCMREHVPQALVHMALSRRIKSAEVELIMEIMLELTDQYKWEMMQEHTNISYDSIREEFAGQFMKDPEGFHYNAAVLAQMA